MNEAHGGHTDQRARDMIASAVARIDRHEAVCERDREEAKAWRLSAIKILDDIKAAVKEVSENMEDRFGEQQKINSTLFVKAAQPDKLLLRGSMALNVALFSGVLWAVLKFLHLIT